MDQERAGGYISQITFNNGESISIEKNDIVIFVGPNNAGKSQSLKDIFALSKSKVPSVVITDITITKYDSPISILLDSLSEPTIYSTYKTYRNVSNSRQFHEHL